MTSANYIWEMKNSSERTYRGEADGVDRANLRALKNRWTIGERVRVGDSAWSYAIDGGGFDPSHREGVVHSIDFRYHGGCGFFPMIWVAPDADPSDPAEWDEDELERLG